MKTQYFLFIWFFIFLSCNTKNNKSNVQEDETIIDQSQEVDSSNTHANGKVDKFNEGIIFYEEIDYSEYKSKYHLWEPTASTPRIRKWNINKSDVNDFFIQETIDKKNRVIEIKFMRNKDSIYKDFTIYENPVIRFYYEDNKLTVVEYDSKLMPAEMFEAGLPTQQTYTLNDQNYIESVSAKVYVSERLLNYFGHSTIENGISEIVTDVKPGIIFKYYFTDSKMNGVIPKAENFDENSIRKPYDRE